MERGGLGRVVIRNMVVCCACYAGLALVAEIFSTNASYVLLGGIFFCMALPYNRWGLRSMHMLMGGLDGVAVDFHPRAKKEFLRRTKRTREGKAGKKKRQPLFAGGRPLISVAAISCRLASTQSSRQPDNLS